MRLKTPQFWYDKNAAFPSLMLWPLSALYAFGLCIHKHLLPKPYKSIVPVICIGNVTAGGSGKTPAAIALYHLIKRKSPALKIAFLTRGYGGAIRNTVLVNPQMHTAGDVGDEALLLARHAPTIKSVKRKDGMKYAELHNYDLVIMDDGMQNNSIAKDFTIMVVDAAKQFGNRMMLPAGPLREPVKRAVNRVNLILTVGGTIDHNFDRPKTKAQIVPKNFEEHISDERYFAFCGLAHPDKFFSTLAQSGLEVAKIKSFPDHYNYSEDDLNALKKTAKDNNLRLITTEKDAVKIPNSIIKDANISVFGVHLIFENEALLFDLISKEITL